MPLVIISGNHSIGSILTVNYYDDLGRNLPISPDTQIIWWGRTEISSERFEISKFRNMKQVQLLNPVPDYIEVQIDSHYSDLFMVNKSENSQSIESLPIVGSGIALEMPVSGISGLSTEATNVRRINQSYMLILNTAKGEYPMLPKLGCNLHKVLFETICSQTDLESIKQDLMEDLTTQEPRGNIKSLNVKFDYVDTLKIEIVYSIQNTNIIGNLIYNRKVGGELNV